MGLKELKQNGGILIIKIIKNTHCWILNLNCFQNNILDVEAAVILINLADGKGFGIVMFQSFL